MTRAPTTGLSSGSARPRGFVLVVVIWVLVLISVLAEGLLANMHSTLFTVRNEIASARAREAADAGVNLAIFELLSPDPAAPWRADGKPHALRYADAALAVVVRDEGGKIDINRAPLDLLAGLFAVLEIPPDDRQALLSGIADRRKLAAEAEAEEPSPEARRRMSRNAAIADSAFASVSELQLLPGGAHQNYERIKPYVTVYSESAAINPLTAPRPVLMALPGVTAEAIDLYLSARQSFATGAAGAELPSLGASAQDYIAVTAVGVVDIIATATTESHAMFSREAIVALTRSPKLPFEFLSWRQAVEDDDPSQPAQAPKVGAGVDSVGF